MRGPPPPGRRRSPPGGMGRDDPTAFPPPPAMHGGRRRGRSPSPPFRRSPPPKRYRRDDYDDRFGPSGPPGPDRYGDRPFDRRGPPMPPGPAGYGRRYPDDRYPDERYGAPDDRYGLADDRYGGRAARSPPRSRALMSFKQFLLELPDDVTPEQAQLRYDDYRADFWGSEFRAYFEAHKDEYAMRQRFDPREHLKAVDLRAEAAAAAAAKLVESIEKGELNPGGEGFNQGNGPVAGTKLDATLEVAVSAAAEPEGDKEPADAPAKGNGADAKLLDDAKRKVAPELCWTAERVAADLKLSRELVAKLDSEKGITDNPLLRATLAVAPATDAADAADADDAAGAPAGAEAKDADGDAAMGAGDGKDPDAEAPAEANGTQSAAHRAEPSYEHQVSRLDQLLTWLWRVHGVDYYAGTEVAEPDEEQRAGPRPTLRCPRPEEGEQADEKLAAEQAGALEKGIDGAWRKRIEQGDPFEKLLQKEKLAAHIDKWIEDQIIKYEDRKWGSRVSQKLFMDREYVVKHIRNKHKEKVDEQKQIFWDEQYWQNFKAERDEEQRKKREAAQRARQPRDGGGPLGDEPPPQGLLRGGSLDGMPAMAPMGLGVFGGRGLPAAGLPGIPDLPPGMMLVPVEGAGPQGPFVPVPIPAGGAGALGGPLGVRPQPPPPRGARPPMMMGGMGRMPMNGGMFMPHRAADYQDLDDPKNNRSVLDYGDL